MRVDTLVLDYEDMFRMISKSESLNYCVFIQVNGVVNAQEIIDLFNFECTEDDMNIERVIMEIHDNKDIALRRTRIVNTNSTYNNYLFASVFKNGSKIDID